MTARKNRSFAAGANIEFAPVSPSTCAAAPAQHWRGPEPDGRAFLPYICKHCGSEQLFRASLDDGSFKSENDRAWAKYKTKDFAKQARA